MPSQGSRALPKDDQPAPAVRAAIAALNAAMARHGKGRGAPVRALSAYVGDRWSVLILLVLEIGEWRHGALRRVLAEISDEGAISQRVLTLKLRGLERDGLVGRSATGDVPPKVSYRLSALGEGFVGEIRSLIAWIEAHEEGIGEARAAFDNAKVR